MVECTKCHQKFEPAPEAPEGSLCPACAAKTPESVAMPQLNPHDVINGYEILKLIGSGGMGSVYLAVQQSMQREVAFKVLNPERTRNEESVKKFMAEVKNAGKLDHPNIVTAHDAGHSGNLYYMAMKYIHGDTVDDIIERDGAFPEEKALDIVLQIASALKYVWKKYSMFHRDIKPGNFMLDEDGTAMLMDMGIALGVSDHASNADGTIEGSPYYMSPEQISAEPLSWATDLYSLGASLFQMTAGVPPFDGASIEEILKKHCTEPVPDVSQRNPSAKISPGGMALIRKMMAKRPAERFASWGDFIREAEKVRKSFKGTALKAPSLKTPQLKAPALKPAAPALKPAAPALKPAAPALKPAAPAAIPVSGKPPAEETAAVQQAVPVLEPLAEDPALKAARKAQSKKILKVLLFIFGGLLLLAGLGAGGYFGWIAFRKNQADSGIRSRMKAAEAELEIYRKKCESSEKTLAELKLLGASLENPNATAQWKEAGKSKIQEIRKKISETDSRIRSVDAVLKSMEDRYRKAEGQLSSASSASIRAAMSDLDSVVASLNRQETLNEQQRKKKTELINRCTVLRAKLNVKADEAASREAGKKAEREREEMEASIRKFQSDKAKADQEKARREAEKIQREAAAQKAKEAADRAREQQKLAAARRLQQQKQNEEAQKRLKLLVSANANFISRFAGMAVREEFAKAASLAVPPEVSVLELQNSREKQEMEKLKKIAARYARYAGQAEEIRQLMRSSDATSILAGEQFTVYEEGKPVVKRITKSVNGTLFTSGGKYLLTDLPQSIRYKLVSKVAFASKKGGSLTGFYLMSGLFRYAYPALASDKLTQSEMEKFSLAYIRIGYTEAKKKGDLSAILRFERDYQGLDIWYKALNIPKPKTKPKPRPPARPAARKK